MVKMLWAPMYKTAWRTDGQCKKRHWNPKKEPKGDARD